MRAKTGILTLQRTSLPKTKAAGLKRHQIAMMTGYLSILLGSSAMWYYKESHHAPHITTWHGVRAFIFNVLPLLQEAYATFVSGLRINHRILALCPGPNRCGKRLVWRCRVRRRPQGQTCLEIPPAVWVLPLAFPPNNCSPCRCLVILDVRKDRIRRSSCCLHTSATWHSRLGLLSHQVRGPFHDMS